MGHNLGVSIRSILSLSAPLLFCLLLFAIMSFPLTFHPRIRMPYLNRRKRHSKSRTFPFEWSLIGCVLFPKRFPVSFQCVRQVSFPWYAVSTFLILNLQASLSPFPHSRLLAVLVEIFNLASKNFGELDGKFHQAPFGFAFDLCNQSPWNAASIRHLLLSHALFLADSFDIVSDRHVFPSFQSWQNRILSV